jgi:hypothetical protein
LQATVSYREDYGEVPLATIVPVNKGTDRALARKAALEVVLPYVPSLDTVTTAQAQRIHTAALAAAGAVERGSYAELALAAAPANDQWRPLHELEQQFAAVTLQDGETVLRDPAAATTAEHCDAVAAALQNTPYGLANITRSALTELKSVAARASGGAVEEDSYVAKAQVTATS